MLKGCDGAGLDQILVHAHQPNNVATRDILNGLHDAPHHQHRPLDGLHVDVLLLPGDVVGAHDPDLLASGNGTREHTSKSVEPPLVTCGHHLADVHDERGLRVRGEGGRVGGSFHPTVWPITWGTQGLVVLNVFTSYTSQHTNLPKIL